MNFPPFVRGKKLRCRAGPVTWRKRKLIMLQRCYNVVIIVLACNGWWGNSKLKLNETTVLSPNLMPLFEKYQLWFKMIYRPILTLLKSYPCILYIFPSLKWKVGSRLLNLSTQSVHCLAKLKWSGNYFIIIICD